MLQGPASFPSPSSPSKVGFDYRQSVHPNLGTKTKEFITSDFWDIESVSIICSTMSRIRILPPCRDGESTAAIIFHYSGSPRKEEGDDMLPVLFQSTRQGTLTRDAQLSSPSLAREQL